MDASVRTRAIISSSPRRAVAIFTRRRSHTSLAVRSGRDEDLRAAIGVARRGSKRDVRELTEMIVRFF